MRQSASESFDPVRYVKPDDRERLLDMPCHYCRRARSDVIDHVHPVIDGGGVEDGNLVPACQRCNSEKGDKRPDQWRAWRLRRGWPWPPPNTDLLVHTAVDELDVAERRTLTKALYAEDAVLLAALIAIRDRGWVGEDTTAEDDAGELRTALCGAARRIAGRRHRALRALRDRFDEGVKTYEAATADVSSGPHELDRAYQRIVRTLAGDVQEFMYCFLMGEEYTEARILVFDLHSYPAQVARIAAFGRRIAEFATEDPGHWNLTLAPQFAATLSGLLINFGEILGEEETAALRALLQATREHHDALAS